VTGDGRGSGFQPAVISRAVGSWITEVGSRRGFTRRRGGRGEDQFIFDCRGTLCRDRIDDCLESEFGMAM